MLLFAISTILLDDDDFAITHSTVAATATAFAACPRL